MICANGLIVFPDQTRAWLLRLRWLPLSLKNVESGCFADQLITRTATAWNYGTLYSRNCWRRCVTKGKRPGTVAFRAPRLLFERCRTREQGSPPTELVYGRNLRGPLRLIRELWEDQTVYRAVVEYVLQRMSKTRKLVRENLEAAQNVSKRYYDRNAMRRSFAERDKVMILRPNRQNCFEVHWDEPAEVIQHISDVNYSVRLPGRRREERVYHVKFMKPLFERRKIASLWTP